MTQKEANESIVREEWRMMDLVKTTAELFFEKIPVWLILGVIVGFPVMLITSYVATLLPSMDMEALNKAVIAGDPAAILALDYSPLVYSVILTVISSLVMHVALQAVVIYTDRWLQGKENEVNAMQCIVLALKRWPAMMFTMVFIILSMVALTMLSTMIPILMTILLLGGMVMALVMTYYGSVVVTLRKKMGLGALMYTWQIISKRFGRNFGALALMLLIQSLITSVLNFATSAMVFDDSQILFYVLISGVVGILSTLPSAFIGIGMTLNYINAERMFSKRAMEANHSAFNQDYTMHGPRPVRPVFPEETPSPSSQDDSHRDTEHPVEENPSGKNGEEGVKPVNSDPSEEKNS